MTGAARPMIGLVVAAALIAAACNGGDTSTNTPTASPSATSSPSPTGSPAPTATPAVPMGPVAVDSAHVDDVGAGDLVIVPSNGGDSGLIVLRSSEYLNFEWSPAGEVLAVLRVNVQSFNGAVEFYSQAGTLLRSVPIGGYPAGLYWSVDGKTLVVAASEGTIESFYAIDIDSGERTRFRSFDLNSGGYDDVAGFVADGRLLAMHREAGARLTTPYLYDVRDGSRTPFSQTLGQQAFVTSGTTISRDGRVVAMPAVRPGDPECTGDAQFLGSEALLVDTTSGTERWIDGLTCGVESVALSNDGSEIAIGAIDGVYGASGSTAGASRLADSRAVVIGVANGEAIFKHIACWFCDAPASEPYDVPLAGGDARKLSDSGTAEVSIAKSGQVALSGPDVRVLSPSGSLATIATPVYGYDLCCARWSADESWIAYVSGEAHGTRIRRIDRAGEGTSSYSADVGLPSPDGLHIAHSSPDGNSLIISSFTGGEEATAPGLITPVGWMSDSKSLIVAGVPDTNAGTPLYEVWLAGSTRLITQQFDDFNGAQLSPDGTHVATAHGRVYEVSSGAYITYPDFRRLDALVQRFQVHRLRGCWARRVVGYLHGGGERRHSGECVGG